MNLHSILDAITRGELTGTEAIRSAEATLERIELMSAELPPARVLNTDQLAAAIVAEVQAGRDVDPVALAHEHGPMAEARNQRAIPALREAQDQARKRLEAAVWAAAGQMVVGDLRPRFEAILTEVAELGDVLTDPAQVLASGDGHIGRHQKLVGLLARMRRVRVLHQELVQGNGNVDAYGVFGDSRLPPVGGLVNPRSRLVVGRAELIGLDPVIAVGSVDWSVVATPAGPEEPLPRLRWLATPQAEAWLPTRSELAAHAKSFLAAQKAERGRKLVTDAIPGKR